MKLSRVIDTITSQRDPALWRGEITEVLGTERKSFVDPCCEIVGGCIRSFLYDTAGDSERLLLFLQTHIPRLRAIDA
ncbi:MAG: hypothetical protein AAF511_02540, partial [Pseudomonadota bacterium]